MNVITKALTLLRASHPEPTAAVSLMAGALAISCGHSLLGVIALTTTVLVGQLSVGWHNDWLDASRDHEAGRTDKPLAIGLISLPLVRAATLAAGILVIPVSLFAAYVAGGQAVFGLIHVLAVIIAWLYNARLKSTVLSFLPYSLAFPLLLAFITLSLGSHLWPAWWALGAASLLGSGAHFANTAPDLEDDAKAGVRGLPHKIGRRANGIVAAGLLLSATALLALGPLQRDIIGFACLFAAIALVIWGYLLGNRPRSRLSFRLSLAVALLDVMLLVIRGNIFVA